MSYGAHATKEIAADHIHWLTDCPLTLNDDLRLFVRSDITLARPFNDQFTRDIMWIKEPFLTSTVDFGRLIGHGHTTNVTSHPAFFIQASGLAHL